MDSAERIQMSTNKSVSDIYVLSSNILWCQKKMFKKSYIPKTLQTARKLSANLPINPSNDKETLLLTTCRNTHTHF